MFLRIINKNLLRILVYKPANIFYSAEEDLRADNQIQTQFIDPYTQEFSVNWLAS